MSPFVQGEDAIIQTLRPHLDFCDAQLAQPNELITVNFIRASFYDQTYISMIGMFILSMGKLQVTEVDGGVITWRGLWGRSGLSVRVQAVCIHGMEAAPDEPLLIIARVAAPGSTQDEQLDLVIGMTHSRVFKDAGMNLVVRVKMVLNARAAPGSSER